MFVLFAGCESGKDGAAGEDASADDCDSISFADVEQLCAAATNDGECRTASADLPSCYQCVWADWVATSVADGTCSFSPLPPTCEAEVVVGDPGCISGMTPCGYERVFFRGDADDVELLVSSACNPADGEDVCLVAGDGSVSHGPAECACACDADFPGA